MADVLEVRDEYRAQHWAMVVQECRNSGLSNREFCRQLRPPTMLHHFVPMCRLREGFLGEGAN